MNVRVSLFISLSLLLSFAAFSQTDPGPRGGPAGAGGTFSTVSANLPPTILTFFNDAKARFQEVASVKGMITGEDGFGLGPRYNSRSCASCHSQPALGGSSPSLNPAASVSRTDTSSRSTRSRDGPMPTPDRKSVV